MEDFNQPAVGRGGAAAVPGFREGAVTRRSLCLVVAEEGAREEGSGKLWQRLRGWTLRVEVPQP